MGKKITILIFAIILLAANAFAVYYFFGKKKTVAINNDTEAAKSIDENNSGQEKISGEEVPVLKDNNNNLPTEAEKDNNVSDKTPEKNITSGTAPQEENKNSEEKAPDFSINNKLVGWGFQKSSGRTIDTVIVHTSYDAIGSDPFSLSGVLAEYKDAGVSPHYIIDRSGKIYRLVADSNIAYHAGEAKTPDGRTNVNQFSVGIEVINTKTGKPTDAQYASLKSLIASLKSKYKIKYVLGHNQIAPGRKDDPWNFDWGKIK